MPIVRVVKLTKHFRVSDREPGFAGTVRHFFRRRYRSVEAVKGIDFAIEPGEIVGFLGPNGAGKTTTLKMLTGLVHPTSGEVEVAGYVPFERRHEFLRQITLVMGGKQQLLWDLPARDTLRIHAAIYEIPERTARERIDRLAGMLEMRENLSQPVRKLSLGERMKGELMVALLHYPRILFLDEPTLGLDVNAQAAIRRFLRAYCEETASTILLTSHYMADITALCERVLLIDHGTLQYDGSLDGIVERFAPYREVKLELRQDTPRELLAGYGELEAAEGREVRLLVRREELTGTVQRLMADFDLLDLTVTDPPIEGIMARIFAHEPAP